MTSATLSDLARWARDSNAAVRLRAAEHPETSAEILVRLACDGNLAVRRAAAGHPNLPAEALAALVRAGSRPDLGGWASSDPSLDPESLARLASWGEWGARLAARHPAATPELLISLKAQEIPSLRADLAAHPQASAELLAALLEDAEVTVRQSALRHPAVPPAALARLRQAGATADLGGVDEPAGELPVAEAVALARGGAFARALAARLPALPAAEQQQLAEDSSREVRRALAGNPGVSPAVLIRLAREDDPELRQAVARHPSCPAEVLDRLLAEEPEDPDLAVLVAHHDAASAAALCRLAESGSTEVRSAVALHPRYPEEHRRRLVAAGSRADLTGFGPWDPELPPAELGRLARTGDWARLLAARHPATPGAELLRLATDGGLWLRQQAAANPGLPADGLELLRRAGSAPGLDGYEPPGRLAPGDGDRLLALGPWARRLLARHPAAEATHLARLAGDPDPQIRALVAAHPATSPDELAALAEDESVAVRWAVVRRQDVPQAVLAALAQDPRPQLRAAVAEHPATSADLRLRLAGDWDEDVRAAASAAPGGHES